MMTTQLKIGDVATLSQRSRANDAGDAMSNKILRAYTRPRGQRSVAIEVSSDVVMVTALDYGTAIVDVIDEESEPAGTNYRFDVPSPQRTVIGEASIKIQNETDAV